MKGLHGGFFDQLLFYHANFFLRLSTVFVERMSTQLQGNAILREDSQTFRNLI